MHLYFTMVSDRKPGTLEKLASEFLGTFLLTFVVGLNLTECSTASGFGPIACGCCLMVLVYAFGPISGGHLNPAVTFAVLLQNGFGDGTTEAPWMSALKYVIAQCSGGALAGLSVGLLVGFEKRGAKIGPPDATGILLAAPLAEFLYSFLLCFVVLNTAVAYNKTTVTKEEDDGPPSGYGVAIGFVLIASKGAGAISGAALNPAVTIGINLMGPDWNILYVPIYIVFQLLGGFAATTALHIVRPASKQTNDKVPSYITETANKIEAYFDPEDTAEFLGTFFVCLTISLNMMAASAGSIWSIGACFMCVIYSLGDVSGGVFNPALTLAFCVRWYGTGQGFGKDKLCDPKAHPKELVKYCLHQMVGAAAGTGVTLLIYFTSDVKDAVTPTLKTKCFANYTTGLCLDDLDPAAYHTAAQSFFAETFGTFFLCFVVLAIASPSVSTPLKNYGAFCVGGAIIAAGSSFGSISGGLLNPAVTLCNSIGTLQFFQDTLPIIYVGGQCLGGVLAGLVFRFVTHGHEMQQPEQGSLEEPLNQETS